MVAKNKATKLSTFDREVEDDLQEEQLSRLWRQYGNIIVGIVISVIMFTAGSQIYQYYKQKNIEEAGRIYFDKVAATKSLSPEEALKEWEVFSENAPDGYALIAKLDLAQEYMANNQLEEAFQTYYALSQNADHPVYFRNFSLMSAAYLALKLDNTEFIALAEKTLVILNNENQIWSNVAKEILAWIALRRNQLDQAKHICHKLWLLKIVHLLMKKRVENLLDSFPE